MSSSDEDDAFRDVACWLVGEARHTPSDVAESAGVDLELARRLWRGLGFPPIYDERFFTDADIAMLRAAAAIGGRDDPSGEMLLQLTRVIGQASARVAEAQVAAVLARTSTDGDATSAATALREFVPAVEPFLGYVWRRHLLAAVRRHAASAAAREEGGSELAVGFADLVGFTAMSQQLDEEELAHLVARFEEVAGDVVAQAGGRVIKMIGDEVMFAVDDVAAAARIALGLVEASGADGTLPEMRAGLAFGATLSWQGDLFGTTVNLASRLVNLARPGTVLIAPEVADKLEGDVGLAVRRLRPMRIKGIGKVAAYVLRRPAK